MDEQAVVLEVQPHGGALLRSGGPGRPRSEVVEAIRQARYGLKACLDRLVEIRDNPESSADDVVKACMGILRISGIEKDKPRPRKRSTFSVVRATPAEQAEKLADHTPVSELPEPDPVPGAPR